MDPDRQNLQSKRSRIYRMLFGSQVFSSIQVPSAIRVYMTSPLPVKLTSIVMIFQEIVRKDFPHSRAVILSH